MAKTRRELRQRGIEGMIVPAHGERLKPLWRALEKGSTWHRLGKRRKGTLRLRHSAYRGQITLEWWGKAIKYFVRDDDGSGMITGAFLGHALRHGRDIVDRLDLHVS